MTPTQMKSELERVIREDVFTCTTSEARGWLAKIDMALARPEDFRGFVGENGWAPAIRACIETADWHKLNQAMPKHPTRQHQRRAA